MNFQRSLAKKLHPRRLLRTLISLLPKKIRYAVNRRLLRLDPEPDSHFIFKVAETKEELEAAFQLLYQAYLSQGLMKPNNSELRVTPYHALPSTVTLICKHEDDVVGTLSVIRDSIFGFPSREIFDVYSMTEGCRIAEISSLAIKKEYRDSSGKVLFPMFRFMHRYCQEYFGVDYYIAVVHPLHFEFYESILFFHQINQDVHYYDFVEGAAATCGILNVRETYTTFAKWYGALGPRQNLFDYMFKQKLTNCHFPGRRYNSIDEPVMTPNLLTYFFQERTNVFETMAAREKALLHRVYSRSNFKAVLPACDLPITDVPKRNSARFPTRCRGRLWAGPKRFIRIEVRDVSFDGIQAILRSDIRFGVHYIIEVEMAEFEIISLELVPTWKKGSIYGFRITESNPTWVKFVRRLESELHLEPNSLLPEYISS